MKNSRQTIHPPQQIFAALILTGILSLGTGMTLVNAAIADAGKPSQTATSEMLKRPSEDVASLKQSRNSEVPSSVLIAVRREISNTYKIPATQLRVVSSNQQSWPDGCLGLAKPGEICTQIFIENGWRVVMSNGRQNWTYRTNETGSLIKLEKGATKGNSKAVPIPKSELPPPLSEGVVFRAIASGGFIGRTYETRLMRDGTVIRQLVSPTGVKTPAQTHKVSRQQVRQFQELLEKQRFSQFNQLSYPAPNGAADYISITLTSQSATTRYADLAQDQLPKPLQAVIQAWNQIANDG